MWHEYWPHTLHQLLPDRQSQPGAFNLFIALINIQSIKRVEQSPLILGGYAVSGVLNFNLDGAWGKTITVNDKRPPFRFYLIPLLTRLIKTCWRRLRSANTEAIFSSGADQKLPLWWQKNGVGTPAIPMHLRTGATMNECAGPYTIISSVYERT